MMKEVKPKRCEFVEGIGKNNSPYTRLDVYLPAIDGGEIRVSCFCNEQVKRLIGYKDESPRN